MHRPLDPRICNVVVDGNVFNRDGSDADALVDRLEELERAGKINLIVPAGVRQEVNHPKTPQHKKDALLPKIYTIPTGLTADEQKQLARIKTALQGNAAPGKHDADARHLFEAAKYGGYYIAHDQRILDRSKGFGGLLPPSLTVVTLAKFLAIFDEYEASHPR